MRVFVPGKPVTQGSKRHIGHGRMIENNAKILKPWRNDVRAAWLDDEGHPKTRFEGAVEIDLVFILYRPKSTPKKHTPLPTKIPDADKLLRAILDAMTSAGVWCDDAQVTDIHVKKRMALPDEAMGCWIHIREKPIEEADEWRSQHVWKDR